MPDNGVTITKHHASPESRYAILGFGYLEAAGNGARVILPVPRELLADGVAIPPYIADRLRHFHQMELDRIRREESAA